MSGNSGEIFRVSLLFLLKKNQKGDAFKFTDALLGEGVRYESAGSLQGGKRVWLLVRLPREYEHTG